MLNTKDGDKIKTPQNRNTEGNRFELQLQMYDNDDLLPMGNKLVGQLTTCDKRTAHIAYSLFSAIIELKEKIQILHRR